jgi:hypothetical protein
MTHRVELVPLSLLAHRFDPANAKSHLTDEIRASIRRHGWVELPVIDERTGLLVAGHGRIEALIEMHTGGQERPDRIDTNDEEWLVPVLRGGMDSPDDIEAHAYLVGSNQTTIAGGWATKPLVAILEELVAADRLQGTGFKAPDLDALLASMKPDTIAPKEAPDQTARLVTRRSVLVDVADDASQRALIDRLTKEGLKCRALNS